MVTLEGLKKDLKMENKMITKKQAVKVLETIDCGLVAGLGKPIPGQFCVEAAVCYALDLPHSDDPECVAESVRQLKITLNDSNWSSPQARAKGLRRLGVIQLGTKDTLDEVEFINRLSIHSISVVVPRCFRTIATLFDGKTKENFLKAADRCELEKTNLSVWDATLVARAAKDIVNAAAYAVADDYAYATRVAVDAISYACACAPIAAGAARVAATAARNAVNAVINIVDAAADAVDYPWIAGGNFDAELSWYCEEVVKILIDMNVPSVEFLELT